MKPFPSKVPLLPLFSIFVSVSSLLLLLCLLRFSVVLFWSLKCLLVILKLLLLISSLLFFFFLSYSLTLLFYSSFAFLPNVPLSSLFFPYSFPPLLSCFPPLSCLSFSSPLQHFHLSFGSFFPLQDYLFSPPSNSGILFLLKLFPPPCEASRNVQNEEIKNSLCEGGGEGGGMIKREGKKGKANHVTCM